LYFIYIRTFPSLSNTVDLLLLYQLADYLTQVERISLCYFVESTNHLLAYLDIAEYGVDKCPHLYIAQRGEPDLRITAVAAYAAHPGLGRPRLIEQFLTACRTENKEAVLLGVSYQVGQELQAEWIG